MGGLGGTGIGCSDDQAARGGWITEERMAGLPAGTDCETGGKRVYWKANKSKQERVCI